MQSYITSIGTANPKHKIAQKDIAKFMKKSLHMSDREGIMLDKLYDASGIETRYSVLEDFSKLEEPLSFFSLNGKPDPSVGERMAIYKEEAIKLALQAAENVIQNHGHIKKGDFTHIIAISCTGMYAPGLDIELVEQLGLQKNIERTCINYMGCYAAFNGLKMADNICRSNSEAKVLMVCVELCSIHFQRLKSKDSLLSNALFSDGAAAVIIEGHIKKGISFSLNNFYCDIYSEGKSEMEWNIANNGFEMVLTSKVPLYIKKGIKDITNNLLQNNNLSLNEINYFAIHPGGKRILEVIEQELGLSAAQNQHAYKVLENYGNMSSATVLFVLKEVMQELKSSDIGSSIVSFAFGPGLTLESMLLNVAYAE